MRTLVLGGSYFAGREIIRQLAPAPHEVHLLNRGTKDVGIDCKLLRADRHNAYALGDVLTTEYDVVVDVSGYTPVEISNVLDALPRQPSKYIFISSAAVYNSAAALLPFREGDDSSGDPVWGDYGVAKRQCEILLQERIEGQLFVIRPPYLYGPHNYLDREQFVWARVLAGEPLFVPGNGQTVVQFCSVETLGSFVRELVLGDSVGCGTYNIGEDRYYTFERYLDVLASVVGRKATIEYVFDSHLAAREYFPFRDYHLFLDVTRWRSAYGAADVDLLSGMRRTYEWFKGQGFELKRTHGEEVLRGWRHGSTS